DVDAARDALARNDALPFLRSRDAVVETGPTGTNVNDLRVLVVGEKE
ncbi:MOFRL family protein, partial [Halobium palmae]